MKNALELPNPPKKDGSMVLNDHRHKWTYASILIQNQVHPITQQQAQIPTVVLTCECGDVLHRFIPQATQPLEVR